VVVKAGVEVDQELVRARDEELGIEHAAVARQPAKALQTGEHVRLHRRGLEADARARAPRQLHRLHARGGRDYRPARVDEAVDRVDPL
jgi:hypothetical protein